MIQGGPGAAAAGRHGGDRHVQAGQGAARAARWAPVRSLLRAVAGLSQVSASNGGVGFSVMMIPEAEGGVHKAHTEDAKFPHLMTGL